MRRRAALLPAVAAVSCALVTPLGDHEYAGGNGSVVVKLEDGACAGQKCGSSAATFVEVGTYAGPCPIPDAGSPSASIAAILGQTPDEDRVGGAASIHALSQPQPGERAFFALVRDAQCGVAGWGCTDTNYNDQTSVTVPLYSAEGASLGACFGPACVCSAADLDASTQGGDAGTADDGGSDGVAGGDGDSGADGGCPLSLLSAGALPAPVHGGDLLAGPGVAAMGASFVIAVREQWSTEGGMSSALRLHRLQTSGSIDELASVPLAYFDQNCAVPIPDDGVGAAFDAKKGGLLAVSLPACGTHGAGSTFVAFDGAGTPAPGFSAVGSFADLTLASVHALAPSYSQGDFELAYVSHGSAYTAIVSGATLQSATQQAPGTTSSFAALAATPSLRTQVVGISAEAGAQAVISSGAPNGSTPTSTILSGARAVAVATSSDGAIVVGISDGGVVWQTLDSAGHALGASPSPAIGGAFLSVDVATTGYPGGPSIVAAGSAGEVLLMLVDAAGRPVRSITSLSGFPVLRDLLSPFQGTKLGVAAVPGAVAVVWLTSHVLGDADPTGGYAILACR